jgi:hypothetical protein
MFETFITWIVALMVGAAPHYTSFTPEAVESPAEMHARYESIARDVVAVTYDPNEKPLFSGPRGRQRSALTVLSIAFYESSFRKTVDHNLGPNARGDNGNSWCLMQLNVGKGKTIAWNHIKNRPARRACEAQEKPYATPCDPAEEITAGWTGEELVKDRQKCIRAAYRYIKMSFGACNHLSGNDRLSAYATGKCQANSDASKRRLGLGTNWYRKSPKIFDTDVIKELFPHKHGEVIIGPIAEDSPPSWIPTSI